METNHEIDLHRLDDDGAPHFHQIGIAPPLTLVGQENPPKKTVRLGGGGGLIIATPAASEPQMTWKRYAEWRRTKCPERDLSDPAMRLADLDQATHEMVGEAAEIGELFSKYDLAAFYLDNRTKLIDECGDAFFCCLWALDAWGVNPLADRDDLVDLHDVPKDDRLRMAAIYMANRSFTDAANDQGFREYIAWAVPSLMLQIQASVGLTANACKKVVYQQREQDAEEQAARILYAMSGISILLLLVGSDAKEAIEINMRKLNARYPTGWTGGGGIRTGEGE